MNSIETIIERVENNDSDYTVFISNDKSILKEKRVFISFQLENQLYEQRISQYETITADGTEKAEVKLHLGPIDFKNTTSKAQFEAGNLDARLFTYGILPSIADRVKASIGDTFCIIIMMFIVSKLFSGIENVPTSWRIIAFIGIGGIYEPFCVSLFGNTIGHRFVGIKVTQENDISKRLSFPSALVRYLIKLIAGWISLLTVEVASKKQALHDKAVGSLVQYRK